MIALTWTPKHAEKFAQFDADWRGLIAQAKTMQIALGTPTKPFSDSQFAGSIMNGSAWNQLYNGAYRVPTTEKGIKSITQNLRDLIKRGEMLLREQATLQQTADSRSIVERFIDRPELEDVHDALAEASKRLRSHNEERNIAVVGPTRSGKTWMIEKLISEQKVNWRFRPQPHMKRRYSAFLKGMAKALGLRDLDKMDIADLEEAILTKLNANPCALAIEELQRFSRAALEFLKCVLNETKATLVIFMKPREYAKMIASDDDDAQQFLGRTIIKIELHVTEALVQQIAQKECKCAFTQSTLKLITDAAEKGGSLSLVREVIENATTFAGRSAISREHVEKALSVYRRGVPEMKTARQLFGASKEERRAA